MVSSLVGRPESWDLERAQDRRPASLGLVYSGWMRQCPARRYSGSCSASEVPRKDVAYPLVGLCTLGDYTEAALVALAVLEAAAAGNTADLMLEMLLGAVRLQEEADNAAVALVSQT